MRRSPLVIIFITVFIDLLSYGMVVPLLPFYVQRENGGALLAGSLGSLYALMQLVSGPVLGALSDRFGRRPVMLACLLGTSAAFTLLALADSLALIFTAILMDGLTGGNLTTAYAYIADVTEPGNRARGLSLVGAAFGLGLIGGPAAGGLLSSLGLSVPAYAAAAVALANLIFCIFALQESLPPERRSNRLAWKSLNLISQLRGLFQIRSIRLLLVSIFALNLAFSGLQNNFPLFSQARFGWDGVANGLLFAFVGITAVSVQGVIFPWVQPRIGERRLAVTGLALMAAGLAGIALAARAWQLYPVIAAVALGSGLSIPSLTALVSASVSSSMQGRLMGGMQALLSLTSIFGPSLAGFAFERVSVAAPYALGSLLSLLALLAAYRGLFRATRPAAPIPMPDE